MAQTVTLPSLGFAILEATIIKWYKAEGDTVKKEEPLASVESDKVTYDVVSPMEGVLLRQVHPAGMSVKVDHPIAIVGKAGESAADAAPAASTAEIAGTAAAKEAAAAPAPAAQAPAVQAAPAAPAPAPTPAPAAQGKVKATPAARNLCRQQGIDLRLVKGSRADGSICRQDVERYAAQPAQAAPAASAADEIIPLTGVRKSIANALFNSYTNAVHVTTYVEVDMTDCDALRKSLKEAMAQEDIKLTFLPFFIQASVKGIQKFPIINAALEGENIVVKKSVDFSIAVNTPKGLLIPVLKGAQELGFRETARRLSALTAISKTGAVPPEYYGAGSISLSNAGSYGAVGSTPIIANGHGAVVWTGAILDKPAVYKGEIVPRKIMNLCVSYDHRIMDGASVAQFLTAVKQLLENPALLIMG